jgi:act minimal PKS acyl carrier protein
MTPFTLDALRTALRSCAGEDPSLDLDGDIAEVEFADLGYDSLALMETASHVARTLGTDLPEEALAEASTPRAFLGVVNARLAQPIA